MEENKEMLELLQKIEKNSRRQNLMSHIRTGMLAVCALCVVILTWTVLKRMPEIDGIIGQAKLSVTQVGTVLDYLEQTSYQLSQVDLQGMVTNVDGLVTSSQQSLDATMEKLGSIDFEALNQAITDLSAVVQPLARLFGR